MRATTTTAAARGGVCRNTSMDALPDSTGEPPVSEGDNKGDATDSGRRTRRGGVERSSGRLLLPRAAVSGVEGAAHAPPAAAPPDPLPKSIVSSPCRLIPKGGG